MRSTLLRVMKKVLFITDFFPPCLNPASKRSGCFAKYLPRYGWQPTVLTRAWTPDNCTWDPDFVRDLPKDLPVYTAPVPARWSRDNFALCLGVDCWPSEMRDPRGINPLHIIRRICREHEISAVWATSPGAWCQVVAAKAHAALGLPWIADFRDIAGQTRLNLRSRMTEPIRRLNELRFVRTASAITTVVPSMAQTLEQWHRRHVDVIPNGFDPDDLAATAAPSLDSFRIVYTGSLLASNCSDWTVVLDALALLVHRNRIDLTDIRLHFYGAGLEQLLRPILQKHPLYGVVRIHPAVSRVECISVQRGAAVLLQNSFPGRRGVITSKIFEYLAARRPILAFPSDNDSVDALLQETGAGVSASHQEGIAAHVERWYAEWKRTGTVAGQGTLDAVMRYSRQSQSRNLADILERVSADPAAMTS